ncbi:Cytosolic sulfotransferase 17 [Dichanthelium oligosanthes]|uniref:Sulfotransferase n=1 Tax=Dichanthelium oligosanthes TaxID=888268 RepID=A0A1E5UK56_9POAL|nr:Cytosolic sulfotransferase 17 [Dichanthelium oligosanthes]
MSQAMEEGSATNSSSEAVSSEIHGVDLVSKLPTREGWPGPPLVLYKNYWLRPLYVATIMGLQNSGFKPRHDDIILATNPKCGTTWTKALIFAINNRFRYEFGSHPLLFRHPQELVPSIETPRDGNISYIEKLPSPRVLGTHMPPSLFPKSMVSDGFRVVYMCREPKDVFVSLWHFQKEIFKDNTTSLEAVFSMFSEGFSTFGPFWDHCLEYWRESIASPEKVLFLKYEDMISEPVKYVIRLAMFLGVPFSTKEEEDGIPEEVVRLCSFEKLSNLDANQTGEFTLSGNRVLKKSAFFRKGKVGDWVNHMSEEMGRKLDCIVEEKLKGSGLVF